MGLSEPIRAAFSNQMNAEMYSFYLYLALAAEFSNRNLMGFYKWMKKQADEEMVHAKKFYEFLLDKENNIDFKSIDATPDFKNLTVADLWLEVVKHEQEVTSLINNLASLVVEEGDYSASVFLQWFITEQVEEQHTVNIIYRDVKRMENYADIWQVDRELMKDL